MSRRCRRGSGEHEVLLLERFFRLRRKSLRLVVLRLGVVAERLVVDAVEVAIGARPAWSRISCSSAGSRSGGVVCSVVDRLGAARPAEDLSGGCGRRFLLRRIRLRRLGRESAARRRRRRGAALAASTSVPAAGRLRVGGLDDAWRRRRACPAGGGGAVTVRAEMRLHRAAAIDMTTRRAGSTTAGVELRHRHAWGSSSRNVVPIPGVDSYLNLAVVHLNRAIHHRQADPAALLLGREIQIEDALQVLGLDARLPCP